MNPHAALTWRKTTFAPARQGRAALPCAPALLPGILPALRTSPGAVPRHSSRTPCRRVIWSPLRHILTARTNHLKKEPA